MTARGTGRSSFYYEAVGIAVQSILAHKLRALLTLTGIIIGVASVVLVGAAISGMNSYVVQRVAKVLGINHFMVARMAHTGDLSEEEWERMDHAVPVCVLGMDVRERLFPNADPIGRTVKVAGAEMRVVGVEARRGSMFGQSLDNDVYIPITTFGRLFGRHQSLQVHGLGASHESFPLAIDEARVAMRVHHKLRADEEDDFGLVNVDEVNTSVDQFTGAIAMVVTPITLISLVVGGIVVMNIMLVSVTERNEEIGVRKAVGARRRDIVRQFLFEAIALTLSGGLVGVLRAVRVSRRLLWLLPALPSTIPPWAVVAGLAVSIGVGLGFGVWPARRAAALDPVEALRYE